jgi:hypothetical protein
MWLKIEHFTPPFRSRAISGAVRDLGHSASGVRAGWIHLKGATCAESRRLQITTAQVSGCPPDQVAFLPTMENMETGVNEHDNED